MKIKVNINRPKLTEKEIVSHKNFKKLFTDYRKMTKLHFNSPKFFSGLIAVATVGVLVYYISKEDEQNPRKEIVSMQDTTNKSAENIPFVNPPMQGIDIEYEKYTVNADKGAALKYKTGSMLKIPKNAFVNEQGNPVKGDVEIRYREFHDPVDFFVSGIPMKYDSAGNEYHFESAGMLEMLAFKDGKPVFMNPEKKVDVELATKDDGTRYNLYELDTVNKNWDYKGKDKVKKENPQDYKTYSSADSISAPISPQQIKAEQLAKEVETIKKEIAKIEKEKPVEPRKADAKKYHFNIDFDPKEFPELTVYKEVKFEVGVENRNFSSKFYNIAWESVTLSENKTQTNYTMTLIKGKEKYNFVVSPVFDGKNYEKAVQEHKQKFQQYQTKLETRKADEKKKQEEYERQLIKFKEEQAALEKKWKEEEEKRMASMQTQDRIFRVFQINGFGIWNCDDPRGLPKGAALIASYQDKKNNKLNPYTVYLVERNRNGIFSYSPYYNQRFSFNPKSKNIAWTVTGNNKLAVFNEDDFAKINQTSGEYIFKMTIIDKELKKVEDIKEVLGI